MSNVNYLTCAEKNYPAYWNLDLTLAELLAHNLEELALSGHGYPATWENESVWKAFLLFHARSFKAYVEDDFNMSFQERQGVVRKTQRSLVSIANVLPFLWD